MLSEYSRRVNTSAAFAQQDRGLQFLLVKSVFFHDCSILGLLSSHVCPRRSLCRLLSRVTHALLVFVFSLSKWKHNAFVEGNASFDSEVTLSGSCRCRVAGKLVCQPLQSDTGQFGYAGHCLMRPSRLRLRSLLPQRVISTSTIRRT